MSSNGEEVEVFAGSVNNSILGYINRTAQKNQAPRIMGGTKLRGWIQSKFKQGQIVSVRLLSSNSLRIEMPKNT